MQEIASFDLNLRTNHSLSSTTSIFCRLMQLRNKCVGQQKDTNETNILFESGNKVPTETETVPTMVDVK